MHLAQLNIAVPKYPLDDPRMSGFMENLNKINELGFKMPGFVWFHMDETGHSMNIKTPFVYGGREANANMSVWETPEHLERFVWNTVHKRFYNRKHEWFDALDSHHFVMWWVKEGHRPTLEEAKERLDHLDKHGNTDFAFGWAHLPHVKLWQTQACG